jgi:proline dehydrogenase
VRPFSSLVARLLPLLPRALVWRVARRYVAGPKREDAVATVKELNAAGAMATVDLLGEEVRERDRARAAVDEYLRLFDVIEAERLDANVSIKLTMLGLKIDESFCRDNVEAIVSAAGRYGNFVRIDMEDRTTIEATLHIFRQLWERHRNLGVVLQAYMRRTLADIDELPQGASVRLCKGIYIEPREVAWKGYETVRANFVHALERLLERGHYVAIATHDELLACAAVALTRKHALSREAYELQMLLGVDEELRRILIAEGHRLRVYVPYGEDWHAYSLRRMRENPEIVAHVMKALWARGSLSREQRATPDRMSHRHDPMSPEG